MRALLVIIGKDLRLLWRDRAGLIFLTIAPIVVITVAGFSLANLYGADPTGQTAYAFPFVDEDHSELSKRIREVLAGERSVRLEPVADRAVAERLVHDKKAGTALVVPAGTERKLRQGLPSELILYTDAVKYLERLNVRVRLLELRDQISLERADEATREARTRRSELESELERLRRSADDLRERVESGRDQAAAARAQALEKIRTAVETARRETQRRIARELDAAAVEAQRRVEAQAEDLRAPLLAYVAELRRARADFETWFAALRRLAGSRAGDIPAPPAFPEPPAVLQQLLEARSLLRVPTPPPLQSLVPPPPRLDLPPLPTPPAFELPEIELPEAPPAPAPIAVKEVNVSGGSPNINTFDQNVPGFSVTFLLLGMLLGVSLALLDERDWGTLERLRAMPVSSSQVLVGKLTSRFLVGVVQMAALFAVGWAAFDVSLGPQPWALVLPSLGIVFAGTAFGLVVAAVAPNREAVLPVGSIVIVTMASVGGCWWPIDLEPRWMRQVALAFPTTWAMDAFNDLMIRRRTVEAALRPTAVLAAYGALYLLVGLTLFRRKASC